MVYSVVRSVLQTLYVLNKGILKFLSPKSAVYIQDRVVKACPHLSSIDLHQGRRKVPKPGWASSNVGGGAQSSPLVEIGLIDLPKFGGAMSTPAAPGTDTPGLSWQPGLRAYIKRLYKFKRQV